MDRCCEVLESSDKEDCSYIKLMGGHAGKIYSKTKKIITLLYPTLYPYNRKIVCQVTMYYQAGVGTGGSLSHEIVADTLFTQGQVPDVLKGYVGNSAVRHCSSRDLDPLDKCRPVDCHQRYGNTRSFFHRGTQLCQPIADCKQPAKALNIWINQCNDMNQVFCSGDSDYFANGPYITKPTFKTTEYPYVPNVRCVHGKLNETTGLCKCFPSWGYSDDAIQANRYRPDTWPYYMCTHSENSPYLFPFVATLITVLIFISCIVWFLYW